MIKKILKSSTMFIAPTMQLKFLATSLSLVCFIYTAGLQMGFFLQRSGRDYVILEKESNAGQYDGACFQHACKTPNTYSVPLIIIRFLLFTLPKAQKIDIHQQAIYW